MLYIYSPSQSILRQEVLKQDAKLIQKAVWIDLINPTKNDESVVEDAIKIDIPTRDEMREIEISSRLYKEDGILFMTATMLAESDTPDIKYDAVTFILTDKQLITIRYIQPHSFKLFTSHLAKQFSHDDATTLLIDFLEITVDRLADILESVGRHLEEYSKTIFRPDIKATNTNLDYQQLLQNIGANADVNTKARESLVSFTRLVTFFTQNMGARLSVDNQVRLSTLSKDILSLSDYANFISSKINFLLDATLGLVSIEQNKIIKIFSVAAVIFLPPTLIASIYGMNFKYMPPELYMKYGYLFAIVLMLLSAWLPYKYFKRRKWL